MKDKRDRYSKRPGIGVALILMVWLGGCLEAANEAPDESDLVAIEGLVPEWRHASGTLLLRADLPGDGSQCSLHTVARGTATTLEPVIAFAVTKADWGADGGPRGSRFAFTFNNAPSQGTPTRATVAVADQVLVDEGSDPFFHPEWIKNATFGDFQSIKPGVAWVVASNLAAHDVVPGKYEDDKEESRRLHEYLDGTTIAASLTCGDHDIPFTVANNAEAIMSTGPPSSGAAHAWVRAGNRDPGVSVAYIGADNNIEWTATNGSWYFGMVGGDPTKAVVVTLEHPDGLTPWFALPTTYGGTGIGDVFMEHQGGPGDYRLSGTGAGTGLFGWTGLIIFA